MLPRVLLVNPNRMRPPVAPIGIEYVASGLRRRGYEPVLCDLTFADDIGAELSRAISDVLPVAIGVSIRNIDDAYMASQDFILESTAEVVRTICGLTERPVVLGGVGFSVAPREVLRFTGAPFGIAGEGEDAFPNLLDCLGAGGDPSGVPGAVYRENGSVVAQAPALCDLPALPAALRGFVDAARYYREGGQAGVETKRGCNRACTYCVDPVAKGRTLRLRSPESVTDEFADLLDRGISVVHLCDSEFNLPAEHAHAVCDALIRRGLAERVRWYTYACPEPFDVDLARAMARAGCAGVNFGVDHADDGMLRCLGRPHDADSIRRVARACRDAGLAVMFDMLLGSPGETRETVARAIDLMREVKPDRVGLACGVRVYPYTALGEWVRSQGPLPSNPSLHGTVSDNDDLLRPVFFVEPALGAEIHTIVGRLVGGDRRFFHTDPAESDGNYNYNDNSVLSNAIRDGARGAYWDILRRIEDGAEN